MGGHLNHGTTSGYNRFKCRCELCVEAKRDSDREYRERNKKPVQLKAAPVDIRTCWRCGVDFDYGPYTNDAPCPDCQYDVEGDWVGGWNTNRYDVYPELKQQRAALIRGLWNAGLNDEQAAKKLGISSSTVLRWRKKLGLSANSRGGFYTHRDLEKSKAHISELGRRTVEQHRPISPEKPWRNERD